MKTSFSLLIIFQLLISIYSIPPIAVFHGVNEGCDSGVGINLVRKLQRDLGVYVECIETASGKWGSIFNSMEYLGQDACDQIMSNPNFDGDFQVLGISQGNLVARYVIEKCPMNGKVVKYLSYEGPQMGVGSIPLFDCGYSCDIINDLVGKFILKTFFRNYFAPGSYYRPRHNNADYIKYNTFLRDLNNEMDVKNPEYKKRFLMIQKMLILKGSVDEIITPISSSYFEYWDDEGKEIVPLKESKFYKEDFIGLRQLDEEGKVQFGVCKGKHMDYSDEEYEKYFLSFFKE